MDKFPLLWNGRAVGELTTERQELYTWFTARCRLPDTGLSAFAIRFGSCYNISYENMP